jgi:hypothetical protein
MEKFLALIKKAYGGLKKVSVVISQQILIPVTITVMTAIILDQLGMKS